VRAGNLTISNQHQRRNLNLQRLSLNCMIALKLLRVQLVRMVGFGRISELRDSNMKNAHQSNRKVSRRSFLSRAAATSAFTIVPRYVLGGPRYTAPSDAES